MAFAMACLKRFELPTFWSVARHSIQLSYRHALLNANIFYIIYILLSRIINRKYSLFLIYYYISLYFQIYFLNLNSIALVGHTFLQSPHRMHSAEFGCSVTFTCMLHALWQAMQCMHFSLS